MPRQRNTFKLGLTIILMVVLGFVCILFISGQDLFAPPQATLQVRFAGGSGMPELTHGAFVHYLGQRVGTITGWAFVEAADRDNSAFEKQHYLEVSARIRNDLELRSDCKIHLSGPPLGGGGAMEISSRGVAPELLDPARPVYGNVEGFKTIVHQLSRELDYQDPDSLVARVRRQLDPQDQSGMVYKINRSMADLNEVTTSFRAQMEKGRQDNVLGKVHTGLDKVHTVLDSADAGMHAVREVVEENRGDLREGIGHGAGALAKLDDDIMARLASEFELMGTPSASLLTKIHDTMDCLNASMADLASASGDVRSTMALNKDQITEILNNTSAASMYFKNGLQLVVNNPWWVFEKPSAADKRERILHNVARVYAEAAARLDLTAARLQSLLASHEGGIPADDPDLMRIRSELISTFEHFTEAENALLREFHVPTADGAADN